MNTKRKNEEQRSFNHTFWLLVGGLLYLLLCGLTCLWEANFYLNPVVHETIIPLERTYPSFSTLLAETQIALTATTPIPFQR